MSKGFFPYGQRERVVVNMPKNTAQKIKNISQETGLSVSASVVRATEAGTSDIYFLFNGSSPIHGTTGQGMSFSEAQEKMSAATKIIKINPYSRTLEIL
ncbi:MAG: hypothetical protein CMO80_21875 [Verrucomicrobiales bacterium]|nr:hypothetical protein [Verrucomicrobiales bacterium]|tara:strand:+ start:1440 stop:1736 length:297 start_codon:yes stop_codon:yes gene_type:complete